MKRYLLAGAVLLAVLLARDSEAQGCFGPGCGGSSSGSSTITSGTTATSGCVAGGVLRSISNLVECGAGLTYNSSIFTVGTGASSVARKMEVANGTAASVALVASHSSTTTTLAGVGFVDIPVVLQNTSNTNNNYSLLMFGNNAGAASAIIMGRNVNQASQTGSLEFITRGTDGLNPRLTISTDGTATFNNSTNAVSPLVVQDNGATFFELKDNGAAAPQFVWSGVGVSFNSASGSISMLDGGGGGLLTAPSGGATYLTDGDNHNRFVMPYTASSSTINNNFRLEGHKHANTSTGYGTGLLFQGRSTTTADNDMIRVAGVWTDATHASRSAAAVFEVVNGAAALAEVGRFNAVGGLKIATGTKPTCNSTYRGTLYYVAGGAGVADTYEACVKDAGDSYAWTAIF